MAQTFFVVSAVFLFLFWHYHDHDILLYIGIGSLCVSILRMYDPFKDKSDLRGKCQCGICQSEPDPIFENEAWEEWNEYWHGSLKKADKEWDALHSHVRN